MGKRKRYLMGRARTEVQAVATTPLAVRLAIYLTALVLSCWAFTHTLRTEPAPAPPAVTVPGAY